jgi:hypothetical protein
VYAAQDWLSQRYNKEADPNQGRILPVDLSSTFFFVFASSSSWSMIFDEFVSKRIDGRDWDS